MVLDLRWPDPSKFSLVLVSEQLNAPRGPCRHHRSLIRRLYQLCRFPIRKIPWTGLIHGEFSTCTLAPVIIPHLVESIRRCLCTSCTSKVFIDTPNRLVVASIATRKILRTQCLHEYQGVSSANMASRLISRAGSKPESGRYPSSASPRASKSLNIGSSSAGHANAISC